jgi:hypothetical protein
MWKTEIEILEGGRVRRVQILRDGQPLTTAEVLAHWQNEEGFRGFFNTLLAAAPYPAFFWETPPVTASTAGKSFEFILADSPQLARFTPEPEAFAQQFARAGTGAEVAAFANLGGDAFLVAPCPIAPLAAYPHLAAFVRQAPATQQQAFWQAVGASLDARLDEQPLWLSTSGLGVAWLHARIDSTPKYYTFAPYRKRP